MVQATSSTLQQVTKMRLLAILFLCCIFGAAPVWAGIGVVSNHAGAAANLQRGKQTIAAKLNTDINSMDIVSTVKGTTMNIDFIDKTKVKITENSRLVIDDFVYDPVKTDASKLALKVSMGTVRYASGQIAKVNQQKVNIKTPTASIAVRGTDFHMTVDELGRSLVVLVPSCREEYVGTNHDPKDPNKDIIENCYVGKITVSTAAGVRELDKPFEATYVASATDIPGETVILALNTLDSRINPEGEINNNLIIVPPAEIKAQLVAKVEQQKDADEEAAVDLVQRSQAKKKEDELPSQPVKVTTASDDGSKSCHEKIRCVEFNPYVTFYRQTESSHYAEVRVKGIDSNLMLNITQDGNEAKLPWGPAPSSGNVITIRQGK